MKKVFFTWHFFALSVFLISCTKNEIQPTDNKTITIDILKAAASSTIALAGKKTDIQISTCAATIVTLFAGKSIDAGNVTVKNDADFIYVTYNTANGYVLTQTDLFVGESILIPLDESGNPISEEFPYTFKNNNETTYTYTIPVMAIPIGSCGIIAAHCSLVKYNAAGKIIDTQTGWGFGTKINNRANAEMKFTYCSCR